jgi:hypothetical protein
MKSEKLVQVVAVLIQKNRKNADTLVEQRYAMLIDHQSGPIPTSQIAENAYGKLVIYLAYGARSAADSKLMISGAGRQARCRQWPRIKGIRDP